MEAEYLPETFVTTRIHDVRTRKNTVWIWPFHLLVTERGHFHSLGICSLHCVVRKVEGKAIPVIGREGP
jgi:hypothetical protein